MNFSFGIITNGNQSARVRRIIESIFAEVPYPNRQIIIVGEWDKKLPPYNGIDIVNVPFNEDKRGGWISKKKNIVTEHARYENICYLHDYVALQEGWYSGFRKFGEDWLTCSNVVLNNNGDRFRDLAVIGNDSWHNFGDGEKPFFSDPGRMLHYDTEITDKIARWLYWSGAYFCAKRSIMLDVPLNEERCWGQGEDVYHARELYFKYGKHAFKFNKNSSVKFLKEKQVVLWMRLPELCL